MSLASHHAVWNSRRGAGMGFGSIAAQAEKELEPHLPKLVPRLYRYQFDPHPKTAATMKNIWSSVVKDSAKTIDTYFNEIMKEVLKGMGDRMWRTREGSCGALSDLLHGRQMDQLEPFIKELWSMCFRAIDDIKESVRLAAFQTAKTLTNLTVRYCNPSYFSETRGQRIMDMMIPFLLTNGLGNMADEVRQFSLATILKLCKSSGILLKPHVSDIICTFLESLSSLEPQMMNYLSFHADKYNITQEQLDGTRLSAAKTSPIMDAIGQCVPFLDADVLTHFIPKLCVIIKKGIGLPTRAGTARFIYMITNQHPQEMRAYADVVLKALTSAIYDRNAIVRKSFSSATGYILKLASDDAILKFAKQIEDNYLEATEEDGRSIAPVTFLEISRTATVQISLVHHIVLPLAFMGARDTTYPTLAEIWSKVWEENTGGSNNAIKKWKKELYDSCSNVLKNNSSWTMRKQVGKAIKDIAKGLASDILPIMKECLVLLFDALGGRTWDGKEAVLEALVYVALEGCEYFETHLDDLRILEDVFIREAKKNNISYKRFSLEYIGLVFEKINTTRYEEMFKLLSESAKTDLDDDAMDVDDDKQKPLLLSIQANAFKSIGFSFPRANADQLKFANQTGLVLGSNLLAQIWNIRVAILDGLKVFLGKLNPLVVLEKEVVSIIVQGCIASLSDGKYHSVREKAGNVLQILSLRSEAKLDQSLMENLKAQIETERDLAIQDVLKGSAVNFSADK
jgi:proteasome component ECM29